MFLSALRKPVDTFAPSAGHLYRRLRDARAAQRSRPTNYGFTLAGDPRMANSDSSQTRQGHLLSCSMAAIRF